jgi:hypothetical protein
VVNGIPTLPSKVDCEMSRLIAAGNDQRVAWLNNNTDKIFTNMIVAGIK